MARQTVDLSELLSEGTDLTLPDGRTIFIPRLGVKTLGEILLIEELLAGSSTDGTKDAPDAKRIYAGLGEANDRLVAILRRWNADVLLPVGEDGTEPEDFAPDVLQQVISLMATGGQSASSSAAEEVQAVLYAREGEEGAETPVGASDAANGAENGSGDGATVAPLRSRSSSRARSSTSARSAAGRRSGGKQTPKSRGSRSKRM